MFDEALLKKFSQNYEAGQVIFTESEPGFEMYIIKTGRVKVIKKTAKATEKILSVLGPGSLFGEMALIEAKPRSATVVAIEKTEVLVVTYNDMEQILSAKPEFLYRLIKVFCKRIRFTSCQISNLAINSTPGRIADLLLILAEDCPFNQDEKIQVRLGVGAAEISEMTGLDLKETNMILQKFTNEGLVSLKKDQSVSITNLNGLKSTRGFYLKKEHFGNIK